MKTALASLLLAPVCLAAFSQAATAQTAPAPPPSSTTTQPQGPLQPNAYTLPPQRFTLPARTRDWQRPDDNAPYIGPRFETRDPYQDDLRLGPLTLREGTRQSEGCRFRLSGSHLRMRCVR